MNRSATTVNATTVAKVLALSLFLGGSGVGYVFQRGQIHEMTRQARANEMKIRDREFARNQLRVRIAEATSRARLELAARRFGLEMQMPDPRVVITLPEPAVKRLAPVDLAAQP